MRIYRSTDRESFGKKSDIANGSILCHYAEQLYLVAGFDVDDKDVEERKLQDAPARVAEIIEAIREHGRTLCIIQEACPV